MTKLFGTDGVRARAGTPPLDRSTIRRLGAALVRALPASGGRRRLLMGRDTRESGPWIEREFACGARSQGAEAVSAGVIPTPAVAYLTGAGAFDAGVVVSASHNPFEDNGIKIFSGVGEKFTEQLEGAVEGLVADASWSVPDGEAPEVPVEELRDAYLAHARRVLAEPGRLNSLRIGIDCAHGATSTVAPRLFRELGFDVTVIGCEPDGRNINLDCGSTRPERLARAVREMGLSAGVAFDGDGDRAIFVDRRGGIVNGDAVMLMCAKHLKTSGRLRGNAVVATVMSNVGLETALRDARIDLIRCPVGDRYVMEEMIRRGLVLGGEQSGHVIFAEYLFTGDGIVTALNVLRVMQESGRDLAELADELTTYPQVLLNVPVREKIDFRQDPAIAQAIARTERRLGDRGRLLVRYSGTEPLLRVMLEGQDLAEIEAWAREIADAVRARLGGPVQ